MMELFGLKQFKRNKESRMRNWYENEREIN